MLNNHDLAALLSRAAAALETAMDFGADLRRSEIDDLVADLLIEASARNPDLEG